MIAGMDFGTTNSGMAVYDGRSIHTLPLDPANPNPRILRTALYITNEQHVTIGREAIDTYFQQNLGRAVKTRKVWVGELEVIGSEVFYITDLYVYVDVLSPGRLFLSVKTSLRDANYPGSVVGRHYYQLEDLIALYMSVAKLRAEKLLDRELTHLALGRPVRFATDAEKDRLAQARLLRAAFNAGFQTVYPQPEPIAAAYSYGTTLNTPENILVFDFGGGTLDLTVMRLGEKRTRKVLATGGIPVAGDVFDQKLVRAKLPRHFGEGSYYGQRHKQLQVPSWIYDSFANWQTMLELQTHENRRILRQIAQTAQRRHQIEALLNLTASNYGLQMFDIIEDAKRTLSEKRGAPIKLIGEGFKVLEFVTRSEFENIIRQEIIAIDEHIDETLQQSGLRAEQIDAVIRTGGSSEIPVFQQMLTAKFGAEKLRAIDTFSSVTAGLGVIGHGIAAGEIDARGYTVADLKPSRPPAAKVPHINLNLLQRRIRLQEGGVEVQTAPRVAVVLGQEGTVTAHTLPADFTTQPEHTLTTLGLPENPHRLLVTDIDETILLISTHYRFLLLTARQLLEQQSMQVKFDDVVPLKPRETFCTVTPWAPITARPNLLLATTLGLARPYPLRVLREQIEAPIPLQFDQPLNGDPLLAAGAGKKETLLLITETGKGVRVPTAGLRVSGSQLVNPGPDDRDRIAAALLVDQLDTELLLVTADGYGRRLRAASLHQPAKRNARARSLIARRSPITGTCTLHDRKTVRALTTQRICTIDLSDLPITETTRSRPLHKLATDERLIALLPD